MNDLMKIIEKQLNNCKKLLSVFQSERQVYRERKDIGIKEIMEIMNKKKELVDAFEAQREIMKQLKDTENSVPAEEREKRRESVRELASMFEQLLVIDRENEMLLRNIMNTKEQPAQITKNTSSFASVKERPALHRQLPLIPGMKPAVNNVPETVKVAPAPVSVPPVKDAIKEKAESLLDIINNAKLSKKTETAPKPVSTPEDEAIYKYKPKSCLKEYAGAGQLAKLASKYA